jgi:DNA-directed RNA polymerase-5 subunit 1
MEYLTLDHLLRFYKENQLKSNKEYGDNLYEFLALVRTDQEKARYTFLEYVQQPGWLLEQNGIVENGRSE